MKVCMVPVILFAILLSGLVMASNDIYPFTDQEKQEQFQNLLIELRCLVCQNQNLADSHAPLAEDLRQQLYQRVSAGETNQQVLSYLTDRYGNFILYKPRINSSTYLLWFGPVALMFLGFIVLFRTMFLRKS